MGAHTGIILRLLLGDLFKLVALSNLVAVPVSYLVMRRILQFFSYSIDLKVSVFLVVVLGSLLLSVITVLFHAIKTARSNPVDSLRYE